jgi:hypothetical protein
LENSVLPLQTDINCPTCGRERDENSTKVIFQGIFEKYFAIRKNFAKFFEEHKENFSEFSQIDTESTVADDFLKILAEILDNLKKFRTEKNEIFEKNSASLNVK